MRSKRKSFLIYHPFVVIEDDVTSIQNIIEDSRARKQEKGKDLQCETCDFKTKSVTLLKQHMTKYHQNKITNSRRIYCNKCDKKFNKESTYEAHMRKAHNENNESSSQRNSNSQGNIENKILPKLTFQKSTRTLRSNKTVDSALDLNS